MSYVSAPIQRQFAVTAAQRFPRRSFVVFSSMLAVLLLVPHAAVYLTQGQSFSPEIAGLSAVILALAIANRTAHRPLLLGGMVAGSIAILLLLHGRVAALFESPNASREYASIMLIFFMIEAAIVLGPFLFAAPPRAVRASIKMFLFIYILIALVSLVDFRPGHGGHWNHPVFPFSEPSHYALSVGPVLLAFCAMNRNRARIAAILAFYIISYFLQSLTLAISTTMVALITVPVGGLAALGAAGAAVAAGKFSLDYFTSRLAVAGDTTNLSALVYREGWELAVDALARTNGWGIGFQQLGQGPVNSESADTILRIVGSDLNLDDGAFTMAKLAAELGVFGIGLTAAYVVVLVRYGLRLRQVALRKIEASAGTALAWSCVCSLAIEVFVRDLAGYFSPSIMMFIAALSFMYALHRRRVGAMVQPGG